jgi:hypothetical protein
MINTVIHNTPKELIPCCNTACHLPTSGEDMEVTSLIKLKAKAILWAQ